MIGKVLTDVTLKRRSFLKWSGALSGTAVLSGGLSKIAGAAPSAVARAAQSEGEWITAACWHNCGGQRCVVKAHGVDGVVKKVKTDDTVEDTNAQPQIRACARGRSHQHQCFGYDRLKYPMKRKNWEPGGGKKELRGRDEWERISWDETLDLVATEIKRLYDTHGAESILSVGGTIGSVFTLMGGSASSWGTTSWGTWY